MRRLNLGCGNDIKKGYINLDITKLPGVDVVWNINKLPLPFKKEEFDEILCKDVLEHVDNFIAVLKDLHRILKKGGVIRIRVPHFTSKNSWADPTHKRTFSYETFKFFTKNHERDYYFDFHFSKFKGYVQFYKGRILFYNYILEILINSSWRMISLYEVTPLRIFPADNLWIYLRK